MSDLAPPHPDWRIGVVAIGRNEGDRLVRCLRSLAPSQCPVVYVDSGSTDGSQAAAASLGARVVALDMARPFTAARARAEGVAALEAAEQGLEAVFFIDGDCELEPGFLPAAARFLADHRDFAVVCGRRRERFPGASPFNRLIDGEWDTPVGEAVACGGDALFRLAAYRAVGGFNPVMLAGEEPELCARLRAAGWRVMRLDAPMTVHDAAIHRLGQWWNRAVRSGMGYVQAWRRTRGEGRAGLYRRQIARALGWALALPLASVALALTVSPWWLLLWPGLTLAQFLRLWIAHDRWLATTAILGKFAETQGIARYALQAARGETTSALVYK